jgi:hypothetical protein
MNAQEKNQKLRANIERITGKQISLADAGKLRRIERALHRWCELTCGTGNADCTLLIERDEETGKPFLRRQWRGINGVWQDKREPTADREASNLNALQKICDKLDLCFYHQRDPRGTAVYLSAEPMDDSNYGTKGAAVYA